MELIKRVVMDAHPNIGGEEGKPKDFFEFIGCKFYKSHQEKYTRKASPLQYEGQKTGAYETNIPPPHHAFLNRHCWFWGFGPS